MNYKVVINVLGKTLFIAGVLLLLPLIINFIYIERPFGKASFIPRQDLYWWGF